MYVCSGLLKGTESISSLNEQQNFKYDGSHLVQLLSPDYEPNPAIRVKIGSLTYRIRQTWVI